MIFPNVRRLRADDVIVAVADLSCRHLGQEEVLLLLRAVRGDQVSDDEVRVDDPGQGHPAPGEFLHHEGVGEQGLTEPAVLLVDRQAEHAEFLQPRHDPVRVDVRVVEF